MQKLQGGVGTEGKIGIAGSWAVQGLQLLWACRQHWCTSMFLGEVYEFAQEMLLVAMLATIGMKSMNPLHMTRNLCCSSGAIIGGLHCFSVWFKSLIVGSHLCNLCRMAHGCHNYS